MSVTLSEVLTLVGPLDDNPGFDTPRERFRGFLEEHAADLQTLKGLIEEAERSLGQQQNRALQDAVVVLGRFLGFETTFGAYQRLNGGVQFQGHWRSHRRLNVVLEILSKRATRADVDELSRSLAAFAAAASSDAESACLGLFVLAPLSANRGTHEETVFSQVLTHECRVASTRSLLFLAEMAEAGRITHDEIVKLFAQGSNVDLVVDLLGRLGGDSGHGVRVTAPESLAIGESGESEPDFWAAVIDRADALSFDQIVKSAVAERRVLGAAEDATHAGVACAGDWICFCLPGKGVVGQAQISAVVDDGAALMRDSDPSDHVYRLQEVELYDSPISPDLETEQSLLARYERAGIRGPVLLSVSRQKFELLTERGLDESTPPRRLEPLRLAHTTGRRWLA